MEKLAINVISYLLENSYEKGGKERNPSNKEMICGLDS